MKIIKSLSLILKLNLIFGVAIIFLAMIPKKDSSIHYSKKMPSQPNIIIIMADDFGYELPTYTGGQSYSTPNLDFMAANGIQFTNAYSHPDGFPSRLAFQTGKYNIRNYTKWGVLPPGEKTIGNMLHDAGYATCFVGRWSMDGGDSGIHKAGFDNYLAFMPFANNDEEAEYRHQYITPHLYQNGAFLPLSQTSGKYADDMYYDYLSNFIDQNGSQPFLLLYASSLVRNPFVPTPDDPEFAGFDPDTASDNNTKFFPGMVKYLDKTIGKVLKKVKDNGLEQNTVVMFCGDNATTRKIRSQYNGREVNGGKNLTTKSGTRTPLEVYWPGTIKANQVNKLLMDYTDFLPTLAEIAGIPTPNNYGTLDGISFYHQLINENDINRNWVYCYWDNSLTDTKNPIRFVHDTKYKLYKDTFGIEKFFRLTTDSQENSPVPDSDLTTEEIDAKLNFETIIDGIHK